MESQLSPLKQALLAIEALEQRLAASARPHHEPIAIVGLGCRLPQAPDLEAFWSLLDRGEDAITEIPRERWDVDALFSPDRDAPGKMYTRSGGFLADIEAFDASFFGISPREAESLDPQQRLLLEVGWEALEHAGVAADVLREPAFGPTGIYVGIGSQDYLRRLGDLRTREPYYGTGNALSCAAGRLAYFLGVRGPALSVDTACSSSLVALHLAARALAAGECRVALVAGVNVILSPETTLYFCRMGAMAPDGRCKAFDAAADGYVRSEGCAAVVLERLSDAQAAGRRILAVIRGSAVNHNGRSHGLTAPSAVAQRELIDRALADAELGPERIDYLEAHGTGTSLGDTIEIEAIAEAIGRRRAATPLIVGSVKSNLGHLEAAAGLAGLLKTTLAIDRGRIPKHLHCTRPNPAIDWTHGGVEIASEARPWPVTGRARCAAVSSFGMNGTNAHVVLEAPPPGSARPRHPLPLGSVVLPISARDPAALRALAARYLERLRADPQIDLAGLQRSAGLGRSHHAHRLAVVGRDAEALAGRLEAWLSGDARAASSGVVEAGASPRVAMLFSGQGGQWPGMGRALLELAAARTELEQIEQTLAAQPGLVAGSPRALLDTGDDAGIALMQPALFCLQCAQVATWRWLGVEPELVLGHSMGEVAAAQTAGMLSRADALRVIGARSRLLASVAGRGAMALLELPVLELAPLLEPFGDAIALAAINGPRSVVVSGEPEAVDQLLAQLERRAVFCRRIKVAVASHSAQVDPLRAPLLDQLSCLAPSEGRVTMISTVTGAPVQSGELGPEYWWRNLRQPVRMADALAAVECDAVLEIGPHPVVLPAIADELARRRVAPLTLASSRRDEPVGDVIAEALAALYCRGARPHWAALAGPGAPTIALPTYAWQRRRHWAIERAADSESRAGAPPALATESVVTGIAAYYDAGAELHLRRGAAVRARLEGAAADGPSNAHDEVVRGYLTYGLFAQREPGFSWIRAVFDPERHRAQHLRLGRAHADLRALLFEGVDWSAVDTVLDVGCGYGSDLIRLARAHAHLTCEGFTISPRQAEIANSQAGAAGLGERVHVWARDSARDRFPGRCQLALAFEVLGLVADKDALFRNLEAALAPGGLVLIAEFVATTASAIEIPGLSTYSCTAAEWADLLARHHLRVVGCVDVSEGIANGLDDPSHADYLDELRSRDAIDPELARHLASYPNTGRALRRGLLSYSLFKACRDPYSETESLRRDNLRAWAERRRAATDAGELATWLHRVAWRDADLPAERKDLPREWIVAGARSSSSELIQRLERRGDRVALIDLDDARLDFGERLARLHLEGWRPKAVVALAPDCQSALALSQACVRASWRDKPRLWLCTRGALPADGVELDLASLSQGALWGLARTVAHEHPELRCSVVELAAARTWVGLLVAVLDEDGDESLQRLFDDRRAFARMVAGAEPVPLPAIRADAAYLVTGGLGGLGLCVAGELAARGAGRVVLLGRGAPDAAQLRAVEALGVATTLLRCDLGDAAQVDEAFAAIDRFAEPLAGVVHAAGTLDDAALLALDGERLAAVLAPKLQGGWQLHQHTRTRKLDFFVLFSGIAGLMGSPGQAAYAAANAALDSLAAHRGALGLPAVSIAWGPWAEIGRVADRRESLMRRGVAPLPTSVGLAAFCASAGATGGQLAVLSLSLRQWRQAYPAVAHSPYFAELIESAGAEGAAHDGGRGELRRSLAGQHPFERAGTLAARLRAAIAGVLRVSAAQLDETTPLRDLGFDSLLAVELRNHLEQLLDLSLPATLVWTYPNVTALTRALADKLGMALEVEVPAPQADAALDLLTALEQLSDEDASRAFEERHA